jgi:hypothetical protein
MSNEAVAAPVVALKDISPVEFDITIDEFCLRRSHSDKRVELLGAFHHMERNYGHIKDTETAYLARYADFANQPA